MFPPRLVSPPLNGAGLDTASFRSLLFLPALFAVIMLELWVAMVVLGVFTGAAQMAWLAKRAWQAVLVGRVSI